MKEPTDLELLDHLLGRASPELQAQLDDALAASSELRRRRDELAKLWHLLAEADVDAPRGDLWPGVSERLAERARRPGGRSSAGGAPSASWWAAASAAVVAAALVGYGSAQLRLDHQASGAAVAVNESDVITQLQLAAFDEGAVQQLGETFVEDQTRGSS